ncbi:DUF262 domain-containing protein [Paracoccus sp. SY]|uniref:DUF262 domain-containing protein n=1 Tax=Paracoccus sp. SY TaxID=1330255 RepID=UPI000CD0D655|nr:DUF262 domain-containing protein [Paracoccus sp. SY]
MSTIVPHYKTVKQLLQGESFAIDEYQREYKWESKHIGELLTDLTGKFRSSYKDADGTSAVSNYDEYFLGSIIVSKRNGKNYLIDGQQRVTSLTLLLIHLFRECELRKLGVTSILAPLIFSDNYGRQQFNIDIPERAAVIDALFNGKVFNPDGEDESVKTMYARYQDIAESGLSEELGEGLPHFAYWLLNRVGLIEIAADSDNHAYAIFETMNDRGKPLSPVDMLKAYLLAPITDVEQRKLANDRWKSEVLDLLSFKGQQEEDATFIKAWLRAQYADSIRERKAGSTDRDWEQAGTVFHRWVRDNSNRLQVGNQVSNLTWMNRDFPFYAKAYKRIVTASATYTPGLESVFYNAHNDFTWQPTVLLAPLDPKDDDETVRRKIQATATFLDIWIMRRTVNYVRVGYSTVSYAMYLLCRKIRRKPLGELIDILVTELAEGDDATFEGSESREREGLWAWGINQFSRRYIYHFLARATAFLEHGSGGADNFADLVDRSRKNPFDIEHIMADDYDQFSSQYEDEGTFQEWRNWLPALLLLPADVNRSLQAQPYREKVKVYAGQNLLAASLSGTPYVNRPQFEVLRTVLGLELAPVPSFKRKQIEQRCDVLIRLANVIWSPGRLESLR